MPLKKSPYDTQLARELFVSDDAYVLANDELNKWKKWRVDRVKELEDELQGCYENGLEDDDYAVVLLKELLESLK